ncbi:MAG: gliding motility protein GldC [Crocinitomicaceae bacterium]|nr:gliding motility protein GldC [Crocinitomicaceae bacterium]
MSDLKKSEIKIEVLTNENNVPQKLTWSAEDGGIKDADAKAMFLALWDPAEQKAMRIDLWNQEMSVEEMRQFFHQTLLTMADSFERATGEHKITADLRDYCHHFADKMGLFPPN